MMADLLSYGNGSLSSSHQPHHGWQQVTDKKAKRRQEAKEKKTVTSTANGSGQGIESKQGVFAALDALEGRRAATRYEEEDEDRERQTDDSEEEELSKPANGKEEEKKPKPRKEKKPRVTVAEAASKIDADDLLRFLEGVSDSFAGNLEIQLMRCADYFARAFATVTTASFQWHNILKENSLTKASEIPLSYVPPPVVKVTGDWLAKHQLAALSKFSILLLKTVMGEDRAAGKGTKQGQTSAASTGKTHVGVLVVLAILLRRRPESLHQGFDTLNVNQAAKVLEQFATLQWALAQVASGDLAAAVWLWVRHLLPLAIAKNASPAVRDAVLQFFENVILANPKRANSVLVSAAGKKGQDRLVPPAALDQVTRAAFPVESARTKATSRFEAIHSLIKELALTGASKSMKPAAAQLLPLAVAEASEDNPALVQEAGDLFVWSLSQNVECFKQWEKLHVSHIQASSKLLSYIVHTWPLVQPILPALEFSKTLQTLHEKHSAVLDGDFSGTVATIESEQKDVLAAARAAEAHVRALGRKLARFPKCLTFVAFTVVVAGVLLAFLPKVDTIDGLYFDSLKADFERLNFFN